ncbi:hypothetical protein LCGC14_2316970 [marine sediment metagenome]|uniref:Uncharacterized protein n=1 Tax=marine sediment metagenome TaxID=412755 RepID=A0A0F9EWG8_9ZZZZ
MRLLPEADKVVRTHLPRVLEAVGQGSSATELRDLEPLLDRDSIVAACEALQAVRILPVDGRTWEAVVRDAAFWCEAAVLAAMRQDVGAFRHHVDKATAAMREGLPLATIH